MKNKRFTVRIGTVERGPKMRVRVMARTSDSAWTKAYRKFTMHYPQTIERRMSIAGAVL